MVINDNSMTKLGVGCSGGRATSRNQDNFDSQDWVIGRSLRVSDFRMTICFRIVALGRAPIRYKIVEEQADDDKC